MEVIHDDPPMPQEIANGFYPAFEGRWRRAELAGRFVMLGFVLVCAAGLLGHGPFSERELANGDGSIRIHYEPVVRFGAPTIIRFDTRVPPGGDQVAVTIAKDLVDQFGLESITPRPATWEVAGGGIRLVFPVPGRGAPRPDPLHGVASLPGRSEPHRPPRRGRDPVLVAIRVP